MSACATLWGFLLLRERDGAHAKKILIFTSFTTLVRPGLLPAPLTPLPSIGPLSVSHLGHSKGFINSTVHPLFCHKNDLSTPT